VKRPRPAGSARKKGLAPVKPQQPYAPSCFACCEPSPSPPPQAAAPLSDEERRWAEENAGLIRIARRAQQTLNLDVAAVLDNAVQVEEEIRSAYPEWPARHDCASRIISEIPYSLLSPFVSMHVSAVRTRPVPYRLENFVINRTNPGVVARTIKEQKALVKRSRPEDLVACFEYSGEQKPTSKTLRHVVHPRRNAELKRLAGAIGSPRKRPQSDESERAVKTRFAIFLHVERERRYVQGKSSQRPSLKKEEIDCDLASKYGLKENDTWVRRVLDESLPDELKPRRRI
jgi:hypothetical protein